MMITSILLGSFIFTIWYIIYGPDIPPECKIQPMKKDLSAEIFQAQVDFEIWKNGRS